MLRHLSIASFALIDSIELDFEPGLTILLGETGAGKSIIIDALLAALGERLSSDALRQGARKAVIEATFDVGALPDAQQFIRDNELEWDSESLVIRRELLASGTSRCFVNDTPTTATIVRELADHMLDLHGQHDTLGLLNAKRHLSILDAYADNQDVLTTMLVRWRDLTTAKHTLATLRERAAHRDAERERLTLLSEEIRTIDPKPDEDIHITQDLKRAESSEFVVLNASAARDALYAMEASAYDLIDRARHHITSLLQFDVTLDRSIVDLESAATACKEVASALNSLADPEDFSAERLEELRLRQVALQRLIRKHGSLDDAIRIADTARKELEQLDDLEESLRKAQADVETAEALATKAAAELTKRRKKAAPELSRVILSALTEMGMPSATFTIMQATSELGNTGADDVSFRFSANAGEAPQELSRIASGGELSRVMLAIKQAMSAHASVGTMIFDEIDTGVSGRIARSVGEVMKRLAENQQIVCITHLPQIASLADNVIKVEKTELADSTTIHAATIDGEEAIVEVARLLSTSSVTDASLNSAREMIGTAPRAKKS